MYVRIKISDVQTYRTSLQGPRVVNDELMYRTPWCTLVHIKLSRTLRLAIGGIDLQKHWR